MRTWVRLCWPRVALMSIDLGLLNLGIVAAYWLLGNGELPWQKMFGLYRSAFWLLAVALAIFYLFGLYHRVWAHASAEALPAILVAVTLSAGLLPVWMTVLRHLPGDPQTGRSLEDGRHMSEPLAFVLIWGCWLLLIGLSRFSWRVWRQHSAAHRNGANDRAGGGRRVLIYGAGSAGVMLAQQLEYEVHGPPNLHLVGFVDDNPRKQGLLVRGKRVLGTGRELEGIAAAYDVDEVIIAIPSASGADLRRITAYCRQAGVPHKVLPSRLRLVGDSVSLSQTREPDLTDLLGRAPAEYPLETYGEYLRGQSVLVTGAGGSIGSELSRQVARFAPRRLILLGRGENRIHRIYRELHSSNPDLDIVPVIANFVDEDAVRPVFEEHRPDTVLHAGAHKHVYLMEANPIEAVRNNVFGSAVLGELAMEYGVERFVLISTDKAVRPTSVMGATKRLCELLVQGRQQEPSCATRFVTVRFGNVLGSEGSVLQIFERQIKEGLPLTITHPEAARFFMTIQEAVLLVLQAGGAGNGGELYVLEMGEPIRILDLAADVIRLHGGNPDDPRCYVYTGLSPGEKVYEELIGPGEEPEPAMPHIQRVNREQAPGLPEQMERVLERLKGCEAMGDAEQMRKELFGALRALAEMKPVEAL